VETKAVWRAAWHDLDQTVVVGDRDTFAFVRSPELMFWNNVVAEVADGFVAEATITSIRHERLGSIRALLVGALDMALITDREVIVIDAEQEPGRISSSGDDLDVTTFIVELSDFVERGSLSEFLKANAEPIAERRRRDEDRWKRLLGLSELPL